MGLPPQTELWLLLSQGGHFILLYFNFFLCKLVFTQPLRCLDEKDLQQDRRDLSASWLWPKKVQYLASEVRVQVSLIQASIGPQMFMLEHLSASPWYMDAHSSLDLPKERYRITHEEPGPGISSTGLQKTRDLRVEPKLPTHCHLRPKRWQSCASVLPAFHYLLRAGKIFLNPLWGYVLAHP